MHLFSKIAIPIALISGLAAWPLSSPTLSQLSTSHLVEASAGDDAPSNPVKAPSAALSESDLAAAASTIDKLIKDDIAKLGLKPTAKTKDEQFLRRVYLDIAGRIPSIEEAAAFLGSKKADKRDALVKTLLASDAHASHMFTWWADLLRSSSRLQDLYPGVAYIDWIKNSIKANKPFDKMVSELITAQGPALARGNGATGYYIVDKGMPEDNMANTVRVFLGTRLSCAQCHDHPFDKWTRKDFFEMVAFTDGVEVVSSRREYRAAVTKLGGNSVLASTQNVALKLGDSVGLSVSAGKNSGAFVLPKDYQYKDARPGQKINALTMFEEDILKGNSKGANTREAYAKWMTSPDNPRFSMVVANRIWKKLMKVGFIEPVDDFMDETVAKNKELADFLTQVMISVKYDLRKFQEIIVSTEAYQRQTLTEDENKMDFHFEGMPLHRLTAEQVWDSLMTLTVANVDSIKNEGAERQYKIYEDYKTKSNEQIAEIVLAAGKAKERLNEIRKDMTALREQMKKGGEAKLQAKYDELRNEQTKLELLTDPSGYFSSRYSGIGPMRRASELESPMPPSHFLRVFGQSDRNVIDNSTDSLNLTQSLDLMNGLVESTILGDPKSVLSQQLAKAKSPSDKVSVIYMAVLSRMPTSSEISFANRVMSLAPNKAGAEYLSWALINSAEFMFNQ